MTGTLLGVIAGALVPVVLYMVREKRIVLKVFLYDWMGRKK